MAYNRYLKRERTKRQFTFTTTKAFVGFVVSVIFSVSLSAYFDRYGAVMSKHVKQIFQDSKQSLSSVGALKPRELERYEKATRREPE